MRVIKFRGRKQGTSTWVYGDLKHDKGISSTGLYDRLMVGGYPVEDNTVGQFTGVIDKSGKGIYEGDILLYRYEDKVDPRGYSDSFCEVSFGNGHFGWVGEITGELHPFEKEKEDWMVSGNIHDNPELLKGGEE